MSAHRASLYAAAILTLAIAPLRGQSNRGTWRGTADTGNAPQPVTVVLDSTDAGWTGSAYAPETQSDSLRLSGVTLHGDTLSFSLSVNGSSVYISGVIKAGTFNGRIWVDDNEAGTIELTRKMGDRELE